MIGVLEQVLQEVVNLGLAINRVKLFPCEGTELFWAGWHFTTTCARSCCFGFSFLFNEETTTINIMLTRKGKSKGC